MKFNLFQIFKMNPEERENSQWEGQEPTSLATELIDQGIVKEGTHVLDLGCGFGRNSNWLASKGAVVDAININGEELNEAKKRATELNVNVNYVKADAGKLPFPDSSFDVILDAGCTHMCDRETQEKSVLEATRLLKTGGYLQYFGFSKEHPGYQRNPNSPQFRDIEDIRKQYGEYFEIGEPKRKEWEHNGEKHIGLEILMKKK
ncbi:MAG TPA: class I SAM-dependent methyltransferase [Candidatus Dojkabacteria bacterium]|nr:class I SAM-dependent methyltransferase [Candidatus Dojkabacteria bacterium]